MARRYRYTWDNVATLDCDHMASWGAFTPDRSETVEFDNGAVERLAFKMSADGNAFSVAYQWPSEAQGQLAEFTQSQVRLVRRPCRFGGTRAYFMCPSCDRTTLRLAVLADGLHCGTCGRVTWNSRREQPLQRLMRKADKLAVQLGCESWRDAPARKPVRMRVATFERLRAEHAALVSEINREIRQRLVRTRGCLLGQVGALVKMGV